jgi:hypothetical protein
MKQPAQKLGRRKLRLKVLGGGNLKRQQHNLSCPDLARGEGKKRDRRTGRSAIKTNNGGEDVDTLDTNTSESFAEKQYLENDLIEIHFE